MIHQAARVSVEHTGGKSMMNTVDDAILWIGTIITIKAWNQKRTRFSWPPGKGWHKDNTSSN